DSELLLGSNFIAPRPIENSGMNSGELQSHAFYKNDNGTFKLVKRINYTYQTSPNNTTTDYFVSVRKTGLTTLKTGTDGCGRLILVNFEFGQTTKVFDVMKYRIFSQWRFLSSETEIFYSDDG